MITRLLPLLLLTRTDYSPFGRVVARYRLGPPGDTRPDRLAFGFSTKFTDTESGLLYYGHRYLDPVSGRWLSRDPIGENGGVNLYGFVGNGGVNRWDLLGLCDCGKLEFRATKGVWGGGVNSQWITLNQDKVNKFSGGHIYLARVMDASCKYLIVSIQASVQEGDSDYADANPLAMRVDLSAFPGVHEWTENGKTIRFNDSMFLAENPIAISRNMDYEVLDPMNLAKGKAVFIQRQMHVKISVKGYNDNSKGEVAGNYCCKKKYWVSAMRNERGKKTKIELMPNAVSYHQKAPTSYENQIDIPDF